MHMGIFMEQSDTGNIVVNSLRRVKSASEELAIHAHCGHFGVYVSETVMRAKCEVKLDLTHVVFDRGRAKCMSLSPACRYGEFLKVGI